MHEQRPGIFARPLRIHWDDVRGYILTIKITEGTKAMEGRQVSVLLTTDQLNEIGFWDGEDPPTLELEKK